MSGEDRLASEIDRLRREPRPFSVADVVAKGPSSVTANVDGVEVEFPLSSLVGAAPLAGDRVLVAWQGSDPVLVGGGIGTQITGGREYVLVAASDSSPSDKARADVVCTGTNDQAVLALFNHAAVHLCAGTYQIDGPLTLGAAHFVGGHEWTAQSSCAKLEQGTRSTISLSATTLERVQIVDQITGLPRDASEKFMVGFGDLRDVFLMPWAAEDSETVDVDGRLNRVVCAAGPVVVSGDDTAEDVSASTLIVDGATAIGCESSHDIVVRGAGPVLVGCVADGDLIVEAGTTDAWIIGCRIGGTVTDLGAGTRVIDGSAGATDLASLTDVADTLAPSTGQALVYGGTEWDAAGISVAAADVTDNPTGRTILTGSTVDANLDAADSAFGFINGLLMTIGGSSDESTNADYTLVLPVRFVTMTALTAARTVTLPSAADLAGTAIEVLVRCDATCSASNTVTIVPDGTDTINGAATLVLDTADAVARLVVDPAGGNWLTV